MSFLPRSAFFRVAALCFVVSPLLRAVSPEEILARVQDRLAAVVVDPILVAAVKEQNASGQTLTQVRAIDEAWMATPGISPLMRRMLDSALAQRLRAVQTTMPSISECFVMDHLGANVAMTEKTSDYWQGDEAKFTECVKDGGRTWVGKLEFDDSTQTYSVQISLPVRDGDRVVGAVCFGINVESL